MRHLLRQAVRVDVNVRRDLLLVAHNDLLGPRMLEALVDERALLRIRLEHTPDERATRARAEVIDRWRARRLGRICAGAHVSLVERVGRLRDAPWELLEVQTIVNDAYRPDVNEARVVR